MSPTAQEEGDKHFQLSKQKSKLQENDVEEIMRNFGIDQYFNHKSVSDPSEVADPQNESMNENESDIVETGSHKKLVRHASLPKDIPQPEEISKSIDDSIQDDFLRAKREELNSTALEGVNLYRDQKKPSKFSVYKGN